jgi:hypothetical protein
LRDLIQNAALAAQRADAACLHSYCGQQQRSHHQSMGSSRTVPLRRHEHHAAAAGCGHFYAARRQQLRCRAGLVTASTPCTSLKGRLWPLPFSKRSLLPDCLLAGHLLQQLACNAWVGHNDRPERQRLLPAGPDRHILKATPARIYAFHRYP